MWLQILGNTEISRLRTAHDLIFSEDEAGVQRDRGIVRVPPLSSSQDQIISAGIDPGVL